MSRKRSPLVTDFVYHIVNRGVASAPVFLDKRDYKSVLNRMAYYQKVKPPIKYSYFSNSPPEKQQEIIQQMQNSIDNLVDIIAYCFMPNHWHLLLKQIVDGGITVFISRLSNSYARYFNVRHERVGPIFQGRFKSILIENDEQLLHVSRYIHLNPYSSNIVRPYENLERYEYSSLPEYLSFASRNICNKGLVLNHYKSIDAYHKFVIDHADYQKKLENIKHLILE